MYRRILLLIAAAGAAASAQPTLSNLAAGVMEQTGLARQSVASRDRDGAMEHVKRAIATVGEIQQNAPAGEKPLLVPVFSQMETTTTVTPVHKNADLKHNSSVRGVNGDATTVRLNVTAAAEKLPAAQAALGAGDWNAADAILGAVAGSVDVTQTTGDMPLRMAKQNLELAKTRVLDGKYHDAALPLKSAAQALGDYERHCSGPKATDIEAARQAMLGFSSNVSHEHDGAAARIDGWMDMVRQWSAAQ